MTSISDTSERDPRLDAAWQKHSGEIPPAHLDAAILAAANRAVGGASREAGKQAPARSSPRRRWMPLAAAATIGAIALGILQIMPGPTPAPRSMSSSPVPMPAPRDELQAMADKDAPRSARSVAAPSESKASAPPPARMAGARADTRRRNGVAQTATQSAGAMALSKKASGAAAKPIDVGARIARIRKLHDDGKLAEAAKKLVALRAAIPDADRRLPADLRAWAATVKPVKP
jgi:hypothetical protein